MLTKRSGREKFATLTLSLAPAQIGYDYEYRTPEFTIYNVRPPVLPLSFTMATTTLLADSHLQKLLSAANTASEPTPQPAHFHELATTVLYNLQHQQDWCDLFIHTMSPVTGEALARPMISGLPPRRAYVHPDEQAEILKREHETGEVVQQAAEQEWVLPTHLAEKWSLRQFADIFNSIGTLPPSGDLPQSDSSSETVSKWRGHNRQKRVLLATLHDDSTIVYYIVHDGIVKPRQN